MGVLSLREYSFLLLKCPELVYQKIQRNGDGEVDDGCDALADTEKGYLHPQQ